MYFIILLQSNNCATDLSTSHNVEWVYTKVMLKSIIFNKEFKISPKIKYEYQAIGEDIRDYFDRPLWHLFSQYHYKDVQKAFDICKKRDNKDYKYLLGILKNGTST